MALILLATVITTSCAMAHHRAQIRQGLLTRGLLRGAFLAEWGPPTRTSTLTGEDATRVGWGGGAGFFFKGKAVYDVWEYQERDVTLVFQGDRLATWKTDKTTSELRTPGS
jgi:hypothetical protein